MSVIEIEALLSDVAADMPCGEDLEYDPLFAEMEKLAQETPERQYGDTIIPAEPPDWRGVKKGAAEPAGAHPRLASGGLPGPSRCCNSDGSGGISPRAWRWWRV
jgi:hypothetical protein